MKERRALDIIGQVDEKYVAEAAFTRKAKKAPLRWIGLAACLCLILTGIWGHTPHSNSPFGFVLTAYAADEIGYEIGETPVVIRNNVDSEFFSLYYEGDGKGRISFPFHMVCEGENIDTITYSIIGEQNAENLTEMEKSNVWFASEKLSEKRIPGDFPEYEARRSSAGTFITTYMGSNYTVAYDGQGSSEMFLVLRIENNGDNWRADDININISVLYKDGTVSEKGLLIHPVSDGGAGELHISLS